jgi:hypothetical protein
MAALRPEKETRYFSCGTEASVDPTVNLEYAERKKYFLGCPTRRPVTTLTELSRVLRKTFINPLMPSGYFIYHHFQH